MIVILTRENLEKFVDEVFAEVMVRIKNLYTQNLIVFGSGAINYTKYGYNIVNFRDTDGTEKILIAELSSRMLASLANLTFSNAEEEFILNSLLNRREIYILKDNIEYKKYENLPVEIYKRYFSYEAILKSYNVKFIKDIEEMYRTILVGVDNISKYVQGDRLILGKNMILTAMAKDYITANRLILERR